MIYRVYTGPKPPPEQIWLRAFGISVAVMLMLAIWIFGPLFPDDKPPPPEEHPVEHTYNTAGHER